MLYNGGFRKFTKSISHNHYVKFEIINDFSPQYALFTGDVVGGLAVGIQTRADYDVPYGPAAVLHNYKEIWAHSSIRWLELLYYLDLL
jgi:hypothetical protein